MQLDGMGNGPTVLVAEPQALPGMWLEDMLTDAGCAVSGPYASCDDAAGSLDDVRPDFAIVSIDLNRGSCFPLACELRRRGVPFALISGNAQVPRAFADVPVFDRLFDARMMIETVAACSVNPGCRGGPRPCPIRSRIETGEGIALDQCPTACRA
ncbi:histidine kinase [Methylobacterium sp. NEAU K]|uniref:histidine kinase n=1 Tax=Methylobacterium sp. NEAU K TaxID=3064946 RepID=UPI002733A059|nr:histidine kinase [Methylobacterium sp. NEAU K]MDP4003348.1 histidine kinase [Methylobacterium sp. NEAU K]